MTRQFRLNNIFALLLFALLLPTQVLPQDLFTEGVMEFQNKHFKKSAEIFEKIIASEINNVKAYQYLINSYIQLKEFNKAIDLIEKNRRLFGNDKATEILLAKLYINIGKSTKGENILRRLNKQFPEDKEIKVLLSRIYYNKAVHSADRNRIKEAIKYLKTSQSYDSNFPQSYAMLGSLLLQEKRTKEADKVFRQGLKKFPGNEILISNYALVKIKKGNYDAAIKDLEKVWQNNKDDIQIGLQLAKLYRVKFKIPEAFKIYESLLKKYPKKRIIYNEMLNYYSIVDDQKNKRKLLEKMEKVFPNDSNLKIEEIKTYVKEGKDSIAIELYTDFLTKHPRDFKIYYDLSALYEKQKNYDKAIETLLEARKNGLNTDEYFLKLGELYEKKEDYASAKKTYREMIRHYAGNFLPYYKMGNIFFGHKQLDSAKTYYEIALKKESNQPFVLGKLAELFAETNQDSKALEFYKRAFRFNTIALNAEQKAVMEQLGKSNDLLTLMNKIDLNQEERMKEYKANIEKANIYLSSKLPTAQYLNELNKLIDEFPMASILYYYKGKFYESKKDFKNAEKYYLRVLSVNPRDVDAQKSLGNLYEKMHKPEKAIRAFKRVLSLNNKDQLAYKKLIHLYRAQGKLNELCDEWLKVHFTQPSNEVLKDYLIEALHKANRIEDAAKIINESKDNE